jgi:hypothetical protein
MGGKLGVREAIGTDTDITSKGSEIGHIVFPLGKADNIREQNHEPR